MEQIIKTVIVNNSSNMVGTGWNTNGTVNPLMKKNKIPNEDISEA